MMNGLRYKESAREGMFAFFSAGIYLTSNRVAELKGIIENTWDNPVLSAHLSLKHDDALLGALEQAGGFTAKGRKRKRPVVTDDNRDVPELRVLQEQLDSVPLRCWGLVQLIQPSSPLTFLYSFGKESTLFMRTSKNSDFNVLQSVKKTGHASLVQHAQSEKSDISDAVLILTVYNRIPWVQSYLARMSQHSVLASQTLGDFIQSIPCDSSEIPEVGVNTEGDFTGYRYGNGSEAEEGCLLLIEGIIYGDGRSSADYTE